MNRRQMISALGGLAAVASTRAAGATPIDNNVVSTIFNPRTFGAAGNGRALDSPAIQRAIDACTSSGGGIVYLQPGTYLSGTVILKSNVTLFLEAGAVILGSPNSDDYKPGHLIYASGAKNISVAGPGKIDGQGSKFWKPTLRKPVPESMLWSDAVHLDWEHTPYHPSPMLEFENCADVWIEDVRLENAPGWTVRPFNCDRVVIRGIAIKNPVYGPNTDGIDPTGCQDVLISDCVIETGDDAICLKSEPLNGGESRLSKNIVVTNCILSGCCNGFKFGTPTYGGFENITFSNSVIYNDDVPLPSRVIAGIQLSAVDGGWVDGVVISGIQMRRVRAPICLRRGTRHTEKVSPQNGLRGVIIDGLHATDAILTSSITGLPGLNVEDVRLSNIRIDTVMPGEQEWITSPVPEAASNYPQSRMFGWLPASGLFVRHVRGLSMRDVSFSAPRNEWRPTLRCDDVTDLRMDGFSSTPILNGEPMLEMNDVSHAWFSASKAPKGSRALVKAQRCEDVLVSGCDLRAAQSVAEGDTSSIQT